MKKNLGSADRIIRALIFVIVAILFFTNVIQGTLGYVLLAASGVLLITSFMNFCPIYGILGIKTNKTK